MLVPRRVFSGANWLFVSRKVTPPSTPADNSPTSRPSHHAQGGHDLGHCAVIIYDSWIFMRHKWHTTKKNRPFQRINLPTDVTYGESEWSINEAILINRKTHPKPPTLPSLKLTAPTWKLWQRGALVLFWGANWLLVFRVIPFPRDAPTCGAKLSKSRL